MAQTTDSLQNTATLNSTNDRLIQSLDRFRSWAPKFSGPSDYLEHLHVLAWLVSILRPRKSIGLGIDQGVAYFALCQAVSEAGLDAQLFGIDIWHPEADPATKVQISQLPEAVLSHHQHNYADLSRLICGDHAEGAAVFDLGGVDLLLVDQDLTPRLLDSLLRHWAPRMSDQGVIVLRGILAAQGDAQSREGLQSLTRSWPHLALKGGSGFLLLLVGKIPAELLALATALPEDSSERAELEAQFSLIGRQMRDRVTVESAAKIWPEFISTLAGRDAALAEMRRQLDDNLRARDTLARALDTARREVLVLTCTAEKFHASLAQRNQENKALLATLAKRDAGFAEQIRQLEETMRAQNARAVALEKDRSEMLALPGAGDKLQEHKASLAMFAERAVKAENALAETEAKLGQALVLTSQKDAEILALLTSTLWKLTAPLRKVKNAIARHRRRP